MRIIGGVDENRGIEGWKNLIANRGPIIDASAVYVCVWRHI